MSSLMYTIAEEYFDPVKYKLIIKSPDESQTTYTYDSFNISNPPFTLTDINVNLGTGPVGDFAFTINDTKDKVIKDTIDCGAIAIIQAAKRQEDYKNIAYGIIDEITDNYPAGDSIIYNFGGLGFGVILNYTLLNMIKSANKEDISGVENVLRDPSFRIDNLALEAFESTEVLPISNSPTLKVRGGFLLDSIADSIKVFMPSINSPLATAATIMDNFAATSGTVFHIDPDKNVYLRPPHVKHSGITIRQCEIDPVTKQPLRLTDDANYTSYYFGGWSSKKTMKAGEFFNKIFLTINTDQIVTTAPGTNTDNFKSLAKKDLGVQFLPGSTKLFNIALLLSKKGTGRSAVEDSYNLTGVQGLICEDDGGNHPSGKVIATFTIPYDEINESPTVIYKIDLQYAVPGIDQTKLHWILLFKTGIDENNTVLWYHDNDSVTESTITTPRYSGSKMPFTEQPTPYNKAFEDGWSTRSAGPVYRYSFFVTNKTTIEAEDPISIRKYTPNRPVEIRVNAPWIQDIRTGYKYANTLLQYGAKLKRTYEKKQLSIPNKLFFPLQLVNIVYPPAGITQNSNIIAETSNIRYSASAYDQDNPFGSYFVELTAIQYVSHFQKFIGESLVCTS